MSDGAKTPRLSGNVDADPIRQFASWFHEAEQAKVPLPHAMTLATASRQGKPAARIVLLKGVDERGFVFFTNYASRKARDLLENPYAALVFCWLPLARQVRIEGSVAPLGTSESDDYFASRPRGHQIEAHASPQSQVVKDRSFLDQRFKEVARQFDGEAVPRPLDWGGYRVAPDSVEFWQEGANRLHDRLRYRRDRSGNWVIERLAP